MPALSFTLCPIAISVTRSGNRSTLNSILLLSSITPRPLRSSPIGLFPSCARRISFWKSAHRAHRCVVGSAPQDVAGDLLPLRHRNRRALLMSGNIPILLTVAHRLHDPHDDARPRRERDLSVRLRYDTPTRSDWPLPMVRLACDKCDRRGQYRSRSNRGAPKVDSLYLSSNQAGRIVVD
jgi:hypothetical protein